MNRIKKIAGNGVLGGSIRWLLKDDFNDTVAAGSVNGTLATPIGGARTATDTESKLSIGSGAASFSGGKATPAWGDPGFWYPARTRVAGRTAFLKITLANTTQIQEFGFDTNQAGEPLQQSIVFTTSGNLAFRDNAIGANVAAYTNTTHQIAITLRAAGGFYFVKGGAFTNWTLLYPGKLQNTTTLFPAIVSYNGSPPLDFVRIPRNLIYITPLASDAFTRANGAPGTTGGGGSEEGGGTGLVWSDQKGVSAIASNVLTFTSLTTSLGIATVPCGTTNVMVEAVCTRTAGNSGLTLRWTDASNYIAAYLDGTNLVVVEVVAGTPNTLATTAVTYGATKRIVASCDQTKLRVWYGDAAVGSELTTAVVAGNAHGVYTSDTGATFDNFVVLPRGNSDTTLNFLDKYTR